MNGTIQLTQPDDFHVHLRDGASLQLTVRHTAQQFARAIIMPNLDPPITSTAAAAAYRDRILAAVPAHLSFQPLMTLYLTDQLAATEIDRAVSSGIVHGVKLYPAGATTNSARGVTDLTLCYPALEQMQRLGLPLLIHGEVTHNDVDIFDREAVFIESVLDPLRQRFPELKMVLEHISTQQGVDFVNTANGPTAGTLTAHHLLLNRNDLLAGGVRPHHYCLPVLKAEHHRRALLAAATTGNPKFFAGTDSAPHSRTEKHSACGCAGIYSAPAAVELYATAFEQAGALPALENFLSRHGANFYGLPQNTRTVTLQREPFELATHYDYLSDQIIPLYAGQRLNWRLSID